MGLSFTVGAHASPENIRLADSMSSFKPLLKMNFCKTIP